MPSRKHALAFLAALPALVRVRPAWAQSAVKIRMGAVSSETYAEPYYAEESGAFARAGLDVEITTFPSGAGLQQAAAAGALDVSIADVIQVSNAVEHGIPYAFFAGSLIYASDAPTTLLCVARNGTVRTANDLAGQAIAVISVRSTAEFAAREWLRQHGGDPAKTRFIELTGPAMAGALARGTVAAAMMFEPFLSTAAAEIRPLGKPYDAVARSFYLNGWYARRDWLTQNAAVAHRLAGAVFDAARWANGHHAESAPILARHAKLELAQIEAMTRATYAVTLDPRLIQPVLDIAIKYSAIERPLSPGQLIFSA